mgnify:FL=1
MYSTGSALYCSPCQDGYICLLGETTATPALTCPQGFVCNSDDITAAFYTKIACPAGYQTKAAITDHKSYLGACEICPAGKYCYAGTVSGGALDCPIGHYCPLGTQYAT